jgi:hypothetical protein
VEVRLGDLLVRKEERKRVEEEFGLEAGSEESATFSASEDYREVRFGDLLFHFGPIQAEVIRALHAVQLAGDPWQSGKSILTAAGSRSLRMADVFKSKQGWRRLVLSNRHGFYRLAIGQRAE